MAWWRRRSWKGKLGISLLAVVAFVFVAGALAPALDKAGEEEAVRGTVASVTDGDTLTLTNGRRVRLVQIDAPEFRDGECYARESAAALRRILPPGTEVRLVADPRLDRVDRFGRQLRYVFKGRENVNVLLVRRGAAAPWFFDGERGRFAEPLVSEAEGARAAGRGLWRRCSATRLDPFDALTTEEPSPPP